MPKVLLLKGVDNFEGETSFWQSLTKVEDWREVSEEECELLKTDYAGEYLRRRGLCLIVAEDWTPSLSYCMEDILEHAKAEKRKDEQRVLADKKKEAAKREKVEKRKLENAKKFLEQQGLTVLPN
jgi:hypothetical protein